ncbi:MAG: hypothetical protein K2I68_05425, partial [Bacteroidales bacterium]|nr:hypothetical protein [Bacteroidales bacterium]
MPFMKHPLMIGSLLTLCLGAFGAATPAVAQKRQIQKADTALTYHSYYKAQALYQKAFSKLKKADKT